MAVRAQGEGGAITDINVTPLVDVILVILIIFMAAAPMLSRRALHVNLPKASKSERTATETTRLELKKGGQTFLDGRPLIAADLERELARLAASGPLTLVAVAADEGVAYGEVVRLLDLVRGAGIRRVGLEVRPK